MLLTLALLMGCSRQGPPGSEPSADCDVTLHRDADGDGFGDALTSGCGAEGWVLDATDCDDADARVHPGVWDLCDGVDEDCDGSIDEDARVAAWYEDADADGYGNPGSTETRCSAPEGFVATGGDCDDADADVHPGPVDTCGDGVDQDCDAVDPRDCRSVGQLAVAQTAVRLSDPGADWLFGGQVALLREASTPGVLVAEIAPDSHNGAIARLTPSTNVASEAGPTSLWLGNAEWHLGSVAADVGDLDGDGETDLALGDSGVRLFKLTDHAVVSADDRFASFAAGAGRVPIGPGDLDGDGLDDLVLGQHVLGDGDSDQRGVAYLYRGPLDGDLTGADAAAIWRGIEPLSRFGWSVASADVDGDGRQDVAIGAPIEGNTTGAIGGGVWLVTEPILGDVSIDAIAFAHFEGVIAGEASGITLDGAGDVDGDGYDDILSGGRSHGPRDYHADTWWQIASVLPGNLPGVHPMDVAAAARIEVTDPYDGENIVVTGAGDLDGDGFSDIALGEKSHPGPDGHVGGSVFVFYGPVEGALLLENADLWLYHDQPYAQLGYSLDGAGDLNGDGFDDLVIGAPYGGEHGEVWQFFGG